MWLLDWRREKHNKAQADTLFCSQSQLDTILLIVVVETKTALRPWNIYDRPTEEMGTAVAQWSRRCATNQEVAGSIPTGVIGIFH